MKPRRACGPKFVGHKAHLGISSNPKRDGQTGSCAQSQAKSSSLNNKGFTYTCSGCNKPIRRDKFLLKACDKYWHENCLRCDRCHSRLGELGSTLYCKANMNLCRQDYLEMFGETGVCSVCNKLICASEMVMRAKLNVYHLECFACQLCNQRFCVGDRFYLCENKVVCQYDFEEHILPIQRSLLEQSVNHSSGEPMESSVSYTPLQPPTILGQTESSRANKASGGGTHPLGEPLTPMAAAPSAQSTAFNGGTEPPTQLRINQAAATLTTSISGDVGPSQGMIEESRLDEDGEASEGLSVESKENEKDEHHDRTRLEAAKQRVEEGDEELVEPMEGQRGD